MSESDLHKFDRRLCEYFVGNIRRHLDDVTFKEWMEGQVEPRELREYVLGCEVEDSGYDGTVLLLNEPELYELADCVDDMPLGCGLEWLAYEQLHRQHVGCVHEVRSTLTAKVAEAWSQTSIEIAESLERPGLKLDEGLRITIEWIREVRRYLEDSKQRKWLPCPLGESPTPTSRERQESATTNWDGEQFREADLQRVRQAIVACGTDGSGQHKKVRVIRKAAGISNHVCRRILRYLEEQGEYTGYGRAKSPRYDD